MFSPGLYNIFLIINIALNLERTKAKIPRPPVNYTKFLL